MNFLELLECYCLTMKSSQPVQVLQKNHFPVSLSDFRTGEFVELYDEHFLLGFREENRIKYSERE